MGKSGARAAYEGNRIVAFVNPKTGESRVFPLLEALKPGQGLANRAKAVSEQIIQDVSLFPRELVAFDIYGYLCCHHIYT